MSHRVAPIVPFLSFFFNYTATTEIYTLSLHTLFRSASGGGVIRLRHHELRIARRVDPLVEEPVEVLAGRGEERAPYVVRSEEHTSELQSRVDIVCRLLLEKKNVTLTICCARFTVYHT